MPKTEVSKEEFEAAGGNTDLMPTLGGHEPGTEDVEESAPLMDARPPNGFRIAGLECRPFSAGVMTLLSKIDHPVLRDDGKAKVEYDFADTVSLLFVLAWPDVGELIDWAEDGTFNRQAQLWGFDLTSEVIMKADDELQSWLDDAAREMKQARAKKKTPKKKKRRG